VGYGSVVLGTHSKSQWKYGKILKAIVNTEKSNMKNGLKFGPPFKRKILI